MEAEGKVVFMCLKTVGRELVVAGDPGKVPGARLIASDRFRGSVSRAELGPQDLVDKT